MHRNSVQLTRMTDEMPATEAQIKASKKYDAQNTKMVTVKLSKKNDKKIIDKLDSVNNKQAYIKGLITADIEKDEESQ